MVAGGRGPTSLLSKKINRLCANTSWEARFDYPGRDTVPDSHYPLLIQKYRRRFLTIKSILI